VVCVLALVVACGGQSRGSGGARPDDSSGGDGGLADTQGGESSNAATGGRARMNLAGAPSVVGTFGGAAGEQSAGEAGDTSLENLDRLGPVLADAQCRYEEQCSPHPKYSSYSGGCLGVLEPKLEKTVEAQVRAGVAAGTIRYDWSVLAKCLERWTTPDCLAGIPEDLECLGGTMDGIAPTCRYPARFECPGGLDGTVELGRLCKIDLECAGDAFCEKKADCYGVCTPRGAEGVKCDPFAQPCTPGSICPFHSDNPSVVPGVCTRLREEGESGCEGIGCTGSLACRMAVGADGTTDHGTCVRPEVVALGHLCVDPSYVCPSGSACVAHPNPDNGTRGDYCAPISASGEPCLPGWASDDPGSCPIGEFCRFVDFAEDAQPNCTPDRKLGEACAYPEHCEVPLECVDGVCAVPIKTVSQCDLPAGRPPGDPESMNGAGGVPAGSFLDTFGWRVADARCRHGETCSLTSSYPSDSAYGGCLGLQGPQLENTLGERVRSGVAAGRITLDPDVMGACLANLATLDCAKSSPSTPKGDLDCPGGLDGTVPLGGACANDLECAGDARCSADDCTGICVAVVRAAEGESCDSNACSLDTYCMHHPVGESVGPGFCTRPKGEGERGCRSVGCTGSLFCQVEEQNGVQDDGICTRLVLRQVGDSCGAGDVCASGSRCFDGHCVPRTADGEQCEDWGECVAADHCDELDSHCLRLSVLGEGCDSVYICQQGLVCVGGRCALRLDNGKECDSGTECATRACLNGHCLDDRSCYSH